MAAPVFCQKGSTAGFEKGSELGHGFAPVADRVLQASLATYEPARVDQLFRSYPGGVYFHFSFWCNVPDPVQNAFCTAALVGFPNDVVLERSAGFYRFVLYRLMPRPEAVASPKDGEEPRDP